MKVAFFSTKSYEIPFFEKANKNLHQLTFFNKQLNRDTIVDVAGFEAVCCFVTDLLNKALLTRLSECGIKLISLRSAGYDQVDLQAARDLKLTVVRVPAYSPHAVAEFTVAMILSLSRKLLRAHARIQQHNFSLEGQLGFNLNKKTIGIVGTGHIGTIVAKILKGFDCTLLAYYPSPNEICKNLGVTYTTKETLLQQSDIISLHCPFNAETRHFIDKNAINQMKDRVMLINTGRGALIETTALIAALESQKISAVGLDVYEYEQNLFFEDHSNQAINDALFLKLQTFPNVLITGHQAYFTEEALANIAQTTIDNLTGFE